MNRLYFITDKRVLIRQAIASWLLLLLSVLIFTLVALILSRIISNSEKVIGAAFVMVIPFLISGHIFLKNNDYYIKKPQTPNWQLAHQSTLEAIEHGRTFHTMSANNDLDKIEIWLSVIRRSQMESLWTRRISDSTLRVDLRAPRSDIPYSVFFHREKGMILFESFVSIAVSGDARELATFQAWALTYANLLNPLSFAFIPTNNGFRLILRGAQENDFVTPRYLERILSLYNEFFFTHYSRIKAFANQIGLLTSNDSSEYFKN